MFVRELRTAARIIDHANLIGKMNFLGFSEHIITQLPGTLPTLAVALEYMQLYPVDTAIIERGISHKTKIGICWAIR